MPGRHPLPLPPAAQLLCGNGEDTLPYSGPGSLAGDRGSGEAGTPIWLSLPPPQPIVLAPPQGGLHVSEAARPLPGRDEGVRGGGFADVLPCGTAADDRRGGGANQCGAGSSSCPRNGDALQPWLGVLTEWLLPGEFATQQGSSSLWQCPRRATTLLPRPPTLPPPRPSCPRTPPACPGPGCGVKGDHASAPAGGNCRRLGGVLSTGASLQRNPRGPGDSDRGRSGP